jgi:hypothetical protein
MGERLLGGVGDGEGDVFRPQLFRDCGCLAMKLNGGTLAFAAHDFNIAPADAMVPSRAQGLHAGFFGGEAGGVTLKTVGLALAVLDFAFRKDATKEAVAEAFDALANAVDFGDINAGAEDHANIVNW